MSLFGNLFGKSFDALEAEGKTLYARKQYGQAKLSLDKALSKSKGVDRTRIDSLKEMVDVCKRALAEERLSSADRLAAGGETEDAVALLSDALEIFDHPDIEDAVQERLKRYEAADTRRLVEAVDEIDDDELLTIIAGTWTDPQAEEYAAMPEALRDALLLGHDEKFEASIEIISELIERSDLPVRPKYLFLELGKLYLQAEKPTEAVQALDMFIERVKADHDADESILTASDMRAAAFIRLEQYDDAEAALKDSCRLAPENHRVFRELGVFLRSQKKFEASIKALEKAQELMGQMHPDITVIRELGFTYLAMEQKEKAIACLKGVIEHFASKGEHSQFDPQTTVALAALLEEKKAYNEAADLYRHLCVGYDTSHHFLYNLQAARLLDLAGEDGELVARYLTRARELAETEAEKEQLANVEEHAK